MEVRKAKRNGSRKFCKEINSTPAVARLHKTLLKWRVDTDMTLKKPNRSFRRSGEEKARHMLKTHIFFIMVTIKVSVAKHICSSKRLNWDVNTFEPFNSPGADEIVPALLQKIQKELLLHIFRTPWSSLELESWRRARSVSKKGYFTF